MWDFKRLALKSNSTFNIKICARMETPKTLPHWGPTWVRLAAGGQFAKHTHPPAACWELQKTESAPSPCGWGHSEWVAQSFKGYMLTQLVPWKPRCEKSSGALRPPGIASTCVGGRVHAVNPEVIRLASLCSPANLSPPAPACSNAG